MQKVTENSVVQIQTCKNMRKAKLSRAILSSNVLYTS